MASRPIMLADEEEPETWDVGTAFANPYVCDSWPFEPNVLANRTFKQEGTMEPCKEETKEDMENEKMRLPNLRALPMPGRFDDDDSEDDMAPAGTSRSL